MTRRAVLGALIALASAVVSAQMAQTMAAPGFAPDRLARLDTVFQRFVDENRLAGAVVLVTRDGKPAYERAFGWSDKEAGRRMTTDTIFRIASQSKAITSTAILSLVEEGKIALGDPAGRYVPGFMKTSVALPDA